MKILFPDTNFFIQCQEPSQLSWEAFFPGENHILLVIPKAVADEVDRQKQDGNSRRAKQARKANSFFREIILAESGVVKIKEAKPIVEATFSPPDLASCNLPNFLDLGRSDDQIIAEMLRYKTTKPNPEPSLLTHDTNPLRTARLCGLSFVVIPDEWLLQPEPDTRDKRISDLERKVRELQTQGPQFEVTVNGWNEANEKSLEVEFLHYPELSKEEIAGLAREIREDFPIETNFPTEESKGERDHFFPHSAMLGFGFREIWEPPSESEIKKYTGEKYPKWLKAVEAYFQELPENLATQNRNSFITFWVDNFGSAAAESALMEFHALGDIVLILKPGKTEMEEIAEKMKFPYPPKAPKGYWKKQPLDVWGSLMREQQGLSITPIMEPLKMPTFEKRDKNGIFWKPKRPEGPADYWCFECEELRHQIEKEPFIIGIGVRNFEKDTHEGAIRCVVSAKNLTKPVEQIVTIKAKLIRMDTKKEVMAHYRKETEIDIFRKR